MTSTASVLFEPDVIRLLETLTLRGRRRPAGHTTGQWRAPRSGSSVEFADYRTYAVGDDFRRIDWNAYARLERLFVRLYRAEEDLSLTLHLDASASMKWGRPSKGRLAAQVAGALAFVALQSGDRVGVMTCRGAGLRDRLAASVGRASTTPVWQLLAGLEYEGTTDLSAALKASARYLSGPGLSIVLSDLLSPTGFQNGIDALLARRQDVLVVHVLARDERDPPNDLIGDWRLVDSEPSAPLQATITPPVLQAYKRLMRQFIAEAEDFCRRRGITYVLLDSDSDIKTVLTRTLRRAGILV